MFCVHQRHLVGCCPIDLALEKMLIRDDPGPGRLQFQLNSAVGAAAPDEFHGVPCGEANKPETEQWQWVTVTEGPGPRALLRPGAGLTWAYKLIYVYS